MTVWQQILTMLLIRSMHRTAREREEKAQREAWKKAHPPRRYTREQRERGIV